MRIGELANKVGVNVQTIRFYERRRLLREPRRTPSGYRDYTKADLETVVFIKWCQPLGFTLKEVRQLLLLHSALAGLPSARIGRKSRELGSMIHMAEEKLASIRLKIGALQAMQKQVMSTIKELQGRQGPVCPASKGPAS
jgi:DNA-binding transcriptional MerR regulator